MAEGQPLITLAIGIVQAQPLLDFVVIVIGAEVLDSWVVFSFLNLISFVLRRIVKVAIVVVQG